jgi:outer membrane protein TolC
MALVVGCAWALPLGGQGVAPTAPGESLSGDETVLGESPAEKIAAEKIAQVLHSAATTGPAAAGRSARLAAEAAARAGSAAGSPSVGWQREGLGLSLDPRPNAVTYLRWGSPFHYPWELDRVRRFGAGVKRWLADEVHLVRSEQTHRAGTVWLELAAELERHEVTRRRLERLDRALTVERKRLELGEVSGSEVTQMELQRAQDAALLTASHIRRARLAAELRTWAGGDFPAPEIGDLAALAEATSTPPATTGPADALTASPWLAAAESRAERQRLQHDLARALSWGRPQVEVEWEHVPEIDGLEGFDALGIALSVPLPLGAQGRRRRAEARLGAEAAERELELARLELAGRLTSLRAAAQAEAALLADLEAARRRLPRAEHSLEEQFRLGAVSYLVLIDGLSRLDEVRFQAIASTRDLLAARLELALLLADPSGFPLPSHLSPTEEHEP